MSQDAQNFEKQIVGEKAADYVDNGMIVGLGTGSTIAYTIHKLSERIKTEGLKITGVSTSNQTSELASSLGIPMKELNEVSTIDLTIDGVDEFDPEFNGVKGGGGALLFEKIVAKASKYNIWVADSSKAVEKLGAFPLPVEVLPFGYKHLEQRLKENGYNPTLRQDKNSDQPYRTDSGNYILDCHMNEISAPEEVSHWLNSQPGVIENGLFINIVDHIILADGESVIEKKRD